ncbi:MAG: hypothetical protein F4Y47_19390 [Acidobacteriia bacterium]|nr:hypothetical protein [Terriglobia bacterium]MYG01168.1 hypothetical protein [Terriglobia bacterium]MYK08334.1 hypothetical protein [Terriglobia bacterium]
MRACAWIVGAAIGLASVPAANAQADPELERVENLVRAGALPRRALVEAQTERLKRGYRETLNRTLLSETLGKGELKLMLDAADGLVRIARENLDLALARVEAGVIPARSLQEAKDELAGAERQAELANTRADLIRQMERMVAAETYLEELEGEDLAYRFEGFDDYELAMLEEVGDMYRYTFGSSPPVSADGDTHLHRSMGLDHTGRIDVALHPDSDEGMFLIYMLESLGIPYIAFRSAVPGQSTGPHIHVGPPSDRIQPDETVAVGY